MSPTPKRPSSEPTGLAREIGKKRPFETLEQEAHLNLFRTQVVLAADFHHLFKKHRLSEALYNALRILRGGDEGRTHRSCSEIGAMMIAHVPDVTRIVDRLEKMGLATRERTQKDRRVVMVSITRKGLDLLAKLDRPVSDLHRQQLGHMTKAELTQLSRLLEKARHPPQGPD